MRGLIALSRFSPIPLQERQVGPVPRAVQRALQVRVPPRFARFAKRRQRLSVVGRGFGQFVKTCQVAAQPKHVLRPGRGALTYTTYNYSVQGQSTFEVGRILAVVEPGAERSGQAGHIVRMEPRSRFRQLKSLLEQL